MTIHSILTQGFGTFGSVNRVPTLGFYSGEAVTGNKIKVSISAFVLNTTSLSGFLNNVVSLTAIMRKQ